MNCEIKNKIIGKATDMFLKLGFKSVTMDDIASEMCISKKTIYKYFSNKEKLIYFLDLTNPSKIVKVDFTKNLTLSEKIKKAQIDAEALKTKTLQNREENIKKIEEVTGSKINI